MYFDLSVVFDIYMDLAIPRYVIYLVIVNEAQDIMTPHTTFYMAITTYYFVILENHFFIY